MLAKLANAYVRAGGDDEKAARILGVTVGSARLAKRRHLNLPTTGHRQKASRTLSSLGGAFPPPWVHIASVTPSEVGLHGRQRRSLDVLGLVVRKDISDRSTKPATGCRL